MIFDKQNEDTIKAIEDLYNEEIYSTCGGRALSLA